MGAARRTLAGVFAGDARVWRAAALSAAALGALMLFYLAKPRTYYTGTDSVEDSSYVVQAGAWKNMCTQDLLLPAGTAYIRLRLKSAAVQRPALHMTLLESAGRLSSALAPAPERPGAVTDADFPIPPTPARPAARLVRVCVRAAGPVSWGDTPLSKPGSSPPTLAGRSLAVEIAVWYLPRAGARRSYLAQAGSVFSRAALLRPGVIGPWTYPVLLFLVLPLLGLLAVRCLALAIAGQGRRMAAWVFSIAAANACCWALTSPVFQAPDEVDHFAYVQSLVERGQGPSHDPGSPLKRWSGAENRALEDTDFFTDHQIGDSTPPWLGAVQRRYEAQLARADPRRDNGGGYTTSAAHGPLYYLALSPAYLLTRHLSIFSQLTLMRMSSALIGALVALFTFLLARELAPSRPWLAVLAALLVAFEPMYGFISGAVNNDVGVNAAAAGMELLLIRMLRRGLTVGSGALTGALLIALPDVKGTGLSLYPVAGLVFVASLWRHRSRDQLWGWGALVLGGLLAAEVSAHLLSLLQPAASATGTATISSNANAVSEALAHLPSYLSYLWQAVLPKLWFMTSYFRPVHGFALFNDPGFVIFVERAWGTFGWYDVFFPHWVYIAIFLAMALCAALAPWALVRERRWLAANRLEALAVAAMPVAVVMGFEAAYYTSMPRHVIAEFGRYAFPAIGPLALLVVGALHAFGRRRIVWAGALLLAGVIGLSYVSQLLTLTSFYA